MHVENLVEQTYMKTKNVSFYFNSEMLTCDGSTFNVIEYKKTSYMRAIKLCLRICTSFIYNVTNQEVEIGEKAT